MFLLVGQNWPKMAANSKRFILCWCGPALSILHPWIRLAFWTFGWLQSSHHIHKFPCFWEVWYPIIFHWFLCYFFWKLLQRWFPKVWCCLVCHVKYGVRCLNYYQIILQHWTLFLNEIWVWVERWKSPYFGRIKIWQGSLKNNNQNKDLSSIPFLISKLFVNFCNFI